MNGANTTSDTAGTTAVVEEKMYTALIGHFSGGTMTADTRCGHSMTAEPIRESVTHHITLMFIVTQSEQQM